MKMKKLPPTSRHSEDETMEVWLYEKLKDNQLTQKKLAEKIGISQCTLSKKFLGKLPFLYSEVVAICEILKIDNPLPYFPRMRK